MPEGRLVRGSRGYGLPYSKGRMAQTLIGSGFAPERASELALLIEGEVDALPGTELTVDELHDLVDSVLAREELPEMLDRFRRWRRLERLGRPLVVVLGGATGTGKSSLATDLAYRLGITRITSSDVVRQVMRAFFAPELMPTLHSSSFEAGDRMRIPMPDPDAEDRALYGFIQQAEQVAVGVNAVLERAALEGLSTVVEGVHLVPGLVQPGAGDGAVTVQALLAIGDEDAHSAHFYVRDRTSGGVRPVEHYLRRFGEIRRIQDYLVARAERVGVPVVEAVDADAALLAVLDLILERAAGAPAVR